MQKFTHVEDYIEVVGGFRDPQTGKTLNHNVLWFSFTPILSLARYDVNVLDSMCTAAIDGKALTTKQGELAVKIITKYSRQLAQKGVDVSPLENPVWRLPLRVMDYTRRMHIQDDKIMIEFPFKTELIDGLREFRKDSQGKGEWNKEKRRWEFALTEYNLSYLKTWCETNDFSIDDETVRLHNIIEDVERTGYAVELDFVDSALVIKNASNTLTDYIVSNCGGFGYDNLPRLIDMAPVLGYTVNADIANTWAESQGFEVNDLTRYREVKVDVNKHDTHSVLSSVVKYAELTNRYPVVLFEPDLSGKMYRTMCELVGVDNIKVNKSKHRIGDLPSDVKYVYTSAPLKDFDIPLLISTAGMMFGGDKSLMAQHTQKAIYFAADVYTNKKEYKVPDFGSEISNT